MRLSFNGVRLNHQRYPHANDPAELASVARGLLHYAMFQMRTVVVHKPESTEASSVGLVNIVCLKVRSSTTN